MYAATRHALLDRFKPTFVRFTRLAEKELSSEPGYLTLGIDTTLPQHRCSEGSGPFTAVQDEFPVWYLFYGTLADSVILTLHI